MENKIQGVIIYTNKQSGTSAAGKAWEKMEYVIEDNDRQYPRKVAFSVFGADKIKELNIVEGKQYEISIDIDAREYKGRWYNDIRAWRAVPVGGGTNTQQAAENAAEPKFDVNNLTDEQKRALAKLAAGEQDNEVPF